MNFRKHMFLIVGGGLAGIVLAGSLFMLFRFNKAYQKVNAQLKSNLQALDRLYRRDPYPSVENVTLVETNLVVLQDFVGKLTSELRKSEILPQQMEPAEFQLLRQETSRKLMSRAEASGVKVAERFAFGFDRYAKGELPDTLDVPRLVMQLKTIEELVGLMCRAKVSEIVSVNRAVFEQAGIMNVSDAPEVMGRRRRSVMQDASNAEQAAPIDREEFVDPSGLFAKERYSFTVRAGDGAVWELLNLLTSSKLFAVVVRVELVNESPLVKITPVKPKETAAAAPSATGSAFPGSPQQPGAPVMQPEPDEYKVVAGLELVKAVIDVDVYRFLEDEKEEAAQ